MRVIWLGILFFWICNVAVYATQLQIIAGGFNSCKLFSKKQFNTIDDDQVIGLWHKGKFLRYGPTPIASNMYKAFYQYLPENNNPYFISCFTGLIGDEHLYYITSDNPDETHSIEVDKYPALINKFIHDKQGMIDSAKLIGHSHGGWLVLQVTAELDKTISIDELTTIDPISFNSCGRTSLIQRQFERLGKLLSWPFVYRDILKSCIKDLRSYTDLSKRKAKRKCKVILKEKGISLNLKQYLKKLYDDPSDGCLTAPWEVNDHLISDRVDYWINYYQEKSFYLHSSIYKQADENILKDKGHIAIDTDAGIWKRYANNP